MKLRLICEGLGIDEEVEFEKWLAGDAMIKRKPPRRFEFVSGWQKDDFKYKQSKSYDGWLKGRKCHYDARLILTK